MTFNAFDTITVNSVRVYTGVSAAGAYNWQANFIANARM
jgi:hypothetical protein